MPNYDYECRGCGHRFDALQSMSEAPLVDCPKCTKPELKRLFSPGVRPIFKGTGFYETDYKRKGAQGGEG